LLRIRGTIAPDTGFFGVRGRGGSGRKDSAHMKDDRIDARLTVVGRLPEGYVILCSQNDDEYSFLVKSLGISVECPHCGATRCGPELAAENYDEPQTTEDDGSDDGFTLSPPIAAALFAGEPR
jgi:hypothetical protein